MNITLRLFHLIYTYVSMCMACIIYIRSDLSRPIFTLVPVPQTATFVVSFSSHSPSVDSGHLRSLLLRQRTGLRVSHPVNVSLIYLFIAFDQLVLDPCTFIHIYICTRSRSIAIHRDLSIHKNPRRRISQLGSLLADKQHILSIFSVVNDRYQFWFERNACPYGVLKCDKISYSSFKLNLLQQIARLSTEGAEMSR